MDESIIDHVSSHDSPKSYRYETPRYKGPLLPPKKFDIVRVESFKDCDEFTDRWWIDPYFFDDGHAYSVIERFGELSRIKLAEGNRGVFEKFNIHPNDTPLIEIQFFEIAELHRGRGLGRRVIDLLLDEIAKTHPDHGVFCFSSDEESDKFWSGIGWMAHHEPNHMTLFVAPSRFGLTFTH